jgi:hypothetical protein
MMSNLTKKSVVLKHSRAIKKGISNKNIGLLKGDKGLEFRFLNKGRFKNNEVLEKTIHAYRMWFLFLKLSLELEEQNTILIVKKKRLVWDRSEVKEMNWTRVEEKEIVQKIKVKRSKYKGWDLDEVLTQSFNEWWQNHSHLFSDEICKVLDIDTEISPDDKHLTLQIDTSLKLTDILTNVRSIIMDKRKANKGKVFAKRNKYSVIGSIHKDALLSKYNALILKLENTLSNQEILEHKDGYVRKKYKISRNYDYNKTYSRVVFGLLDSNGVNLGAKQLLLNVCDGYFMKHPTKTYL